MNGMDARSNIVTLVASQRQSSIHPALQWIGNLSRDVDTGVLDQRLTVTSVLNLHLRLLRSRPAIHTGKAGLDLP